MKRTILLLAFCCFAILCGCSDANPSSSDIQQPVSSQTNSNSDIAPPEPAPVLVTGFYGAADNTYSEKGFYKLSARPEGGSNILYMEYSSRRMQPLCGRQECAHQDETCASWFPTRMGAVFLNAAQDTVFCDVYAQNGEEAIWALDRNGENRRLFLQYAAGEHTAGAVASDASFLYLTVTSVDPQTTLCERKLLKVDLQTGQRTELLSLGLKDCLFGTFEDALILLRDQDDGQYRYTLFSLSSYEEKEIFRVASSNVIAAYAHDGFLYVMEPNGDSSAQISRRKIAGGEWTVLCDSLPWYGSETDSFQGVYDGRLIIELKDTREKDFDKAKYYRYSVDYETGDITELSLTYSQGKLANFVTIAAESSDGFLVFTGKKSVPAFSTDKDGNSEETTIFIDKYAFMDKKDYWNNVPNYQIIPFDE